MAEGPGLNAILEDPGLLHRAKRDLDRRIAGEDKNKLTVWLVDASALAGRPLGAIILGVSSGGKSWLMNNATKGFERLEMVEDYTRMTTASPDRLSGDYTGKILKVQELKGVEAAQATIRVWISEGQLNLLTTVRDKSGNITTQRIVTKGVPVFLTTSTAAQPDEELLNRIFILSVDESTEQTLRVLLHEAAEFEEPETSLESSDVDDALYEAVGQLLLSPVRGVLIPYSRRLATAFPARDPRARRDFKKLLNLIYVVAWLHQRQRPTVQHGENKLLTYSLALPVDFWTTWRIIDEGMRETLLGVQSRALKVLEVFKNDLTVELTTAQVAAETEYSQSRVRDLLKALVHYGFLLEDDSEKTHRFRLRKKLEDAAIFQLVTSLGDFSEKELTAYCEAKNLKILSWRYTSAYIDPITGEPCDTSTPPDRILTKLAKKEEKTPELEEKPTDATSSSLETSTGDSTRCPHCGEPVQPGPGTVEDVARGRRWHTDCYNRSRGTP